jgi:hypothetical protein
MDKVKGMFGQHADKIGSGIDKTAEFIDDKTGGKYAGNVDKAQDMTKDAIDKMNKK